MSNVAFRRLLLAGAAVTLTAIISGGLVSATNSAVACSVWPVCVEELAAAGGPAAWLAFGHRLLVGASLLLVLAAALAAFRRREADPLVRWPLAAAPLLLLVQSGFGALMVWLGRFELADVGHLALALGLLALQVVPLVAAHQPAPPAARQGARSARERRRLGGLAWWAAGAAGVFVLALAGRAIPALPLSTAGVPASAGGAFAVSAALSGATLWRAWRSHRADRLLLGAGLLALGALALAGPLLLLPARLSGLGLGPGAALWAVAVGFAVLAGRRPLPATAAAPAVPAEPGRLRALMADYVSLTKPKVISLLLVTTLAAMYITEAGAPSLWLVLWTMVGGYLAAGGAGAINCALDSDIDINMGRTSRRPVPSGRISRRAALAFGLALSALSVAVMLLFTTPLAAFFSTLGIVYYAYLYTRLLKRSTWQNIIIGGGAGAIPPLVGWTAVTGSLSLAAVLLFAIVFYWTPPHFWALALVKQKDYARAGVPMLPVVAGEAETRWQILVYSALLIALSLLPTAIGAMGWIYLLGAVALGAPFMRYAWGIYRVGDQPNIWGMYKYSLLYLALLFAVMVLDRAVL